MYHNIALTRAIILHDEYITLWHFSFILLDYTSGTVYSLRVYKVQRGDHNNALKPTSTVDDPFKILHMKIPISAA